MAKKICIFLLVVLCMLPVSSITVKAGDNVIANDETGIPDKKLYGEILKTLRTKSEDKFTKKEAERVESLLLWIDEDVSFQGIGCFKNLKELHCVGIDTGNLREISEELPQLKRLIINGFDMDVSRKKIESLKPLENMKQLVYLDVANNSLTNLDGIGGMKSLKTLRAENNQIINIKDMKSLKTLKQLYLSNNRLKDLKGIEKLKKLEELDLSENCLPNIKGIKKLKNLKILSLRYNNLKSVAGIKELKNLKVLNLGQNCLKKADEAAQLIKLQNLSLYGNKLEKLPDLKKLKELKYLNAEDNDLKTLPDMKGLKGADIYLKWNYLTKKEIKKKMPKSSRRYNYLWKNQKANIKLTYLSPETKEEITKDTTEIVGRVSPTIIQECTPQIYLCTSDGELIGWDGSMYTMPEADRNGIFRLDGLDLKKYAGKEICLVLAVDFDIERFAIDRFTVQE